MSPVSQLAPPNAVSAAPQIRLRNPDSKTRKPSTMIPSDIAHLLSLTDAERPDDARRAPAGPEGGAAACCSTSSLPLPSLVDVALQVIQGQRLVNVLHGRTTRPAASDTATAAPPRATRLSRG